MWTYDTLISIVDQVSDVVHHAARFRLDADHRLIPLVDEEGRLVGNVAVTACASVESKLKHSITD